MATRKPARIYRDTKRAFQELTIFLPDETEDLVLALEILRTIKETKQSAGPRGIRTPDSSNTILIPQIPTLRAS